jgi:hypothetical protein
MKKYKIKNGAKNIFSSGLCDALFEFSYCIIASRCMQQSQVAIYVSMKKHRDLLPHDFSFIFCKGLSGAFEPQNTS